VALSPLMQDSSHFYAGHPKVCRMQSYEPGAYIQLYSVLMLVWVAGYWKLTT